MRAGEHGVHRGRSERRLFFFGIAREDVPALGFVPDGLVGIRAEMHLVRRALPEPENLAKETASGLRIGRSASFGLGRWSSP